MASTIASLIIKLFADSSTLQQGFDDAKKKSKGFLGDLKSMFGKSSTLGLLTKTLMGGGAIAGIGLIAKEFAKTGEEAEKLTTEFRQGKINSDQLAQGLLESVPIIGSLVKGAEGFSEALTGAKEQARKAAEELTKAAARGKFGADTEAAADRQFALAQAQGTAEKKLALDFAYQDKVKALKEKGKKDEIADFDLRYTLKTMEATHALESAKLEDTSTQDLIKSLRMKNLEIKAGSDQATLAAAAANGATLEEMAAIQRLIDNHRILLGIKTKEDEAEKKRLEHIQDIVDVENEIKRLKLAVSTAGMSDIDKTIAALADKGIPKGTLDRLKEFLSTLKDIQDTAEQTKATTERLNALRLSVLTPDERYARELTQLQQLFAEAKKQGRPFSPERQDRAISDLRDSIYGKPSAPSLMTPASFAPHIAAGLERAGGWGGLLTEDKKQTKYLAELVRYAAKSPRGLAP